MDPVPLKYDDLRHTFVGTTVLAIIVHIGNEPCLHRIRFDGEPAENGWFHTSSELLASNYRATGRDAGTKFSLNFLGLVQDGWRANRCFADTPENLAFLTALVRRNSPTEYFVMVGLDPAAHEEMSKLQEKRGMAYLIMDEEEERRLRQ